MTRRLAVATVVLAVVLGACGQPTGDTAHDTIGADEPVLQITSEGGFAPVEVILDVGPSYTLLGDGRLIYRGVETMEFPGALLPSYLIGELGPEQVTEVMDLVVEIGLPDIDEEYDDTAAKFVADATTEVVVLWDETGSHQLSVYALGTEESPSARNAVFLELIETLDGFSRTFDADDYLSERVRVVAGPGYVNEDFEDVREWPLDDTDFSEWDMLPNAWYCDVMGAAVLDQLADASQATVWEHPAGDPGVIKLLARPLQPGEPDCP